MNDSSRYWSAWARFLQRWGMNDLVAWGLEGLAPLNLLLAQVVYAGAPLLEGLLPRGEWQALGSLLENRQSSAAFAALLRQEVSQ
ncbi:MAG: hypothetical protein KA988_05470 [Longilinea sp.]|nr:hypothetical protein [Longilinea sp.]MCA1953886.1 hypothetical protein [Anaerolinea sp.]